jgi:hypothetical protein
MQKKPNQQTAGDHLLSQTALAKALKVCPVTVSRWTTARIIPCHRVGAKFVRYDLAAVLAAIAKAENIAATWAYKLDYLTNHPA